LGLEKLGKVGSFEKLTQKDNQWVKDCYALASAIVAMMTTRNLELLGLFIDNAIGLSKVLLL
jgi:hypothetical protein